MNIEVKKDTTYTLTLQLTEQEAVAFKHLGDCVTVSEFCDIKKEVRGLLDTIKRVKLPTIP